MDKQGREQQPLVGYMMAAMQDVLTVPGERAKAIEDFKTQNTVPEGTTAFGQAFAAFLTDRIRAKAEETRARDEACGTSED